MQEVKVWFILESIAIFSALSQYIHKQFLCISAQAMIFNNLHYPITVQIHAYQDLESVKLSGDLRSTVAMKRKKPSMVICDKIP